MFPGQTFEISQISELQILRVNDSLQRVFTPFFRLNIELANIKKKLRKIQMLNPIIAWLPVHQSAMAYLKFRRKKKVRGNGIAVRDILLGQLKSNFGVSEKKIVAARLI